MEREEPPLELQWREVGSPFCCHKLRLACSGELIAIGSLTLIAFRRTASGAELLKFICVRCRAAHESPLLS